MRGPLALVPSSGLRQASRGPQVRKQADGHLAQVFGSCWQLEETLPAFCLEHRLVTSQDAGLPSLRGTGLQCHRRVGPRRAGLPACPSDR